MNLLEVIAGCARELAEKHAGVASMLDEMEQRERTAITVANVQRFTKGNLEKVISILNEMLPKDMQVKLPPPPKPEIPY